MDNVQNIMEYQQFSKPQLYYVKHNGLHYKTLQVMNYCHTNWKPSTLTLKYNTKDIL